MKNYTYRSNFWLSPFQINFSSEEAHSSRLCLVSSLISNREMCHLHLRRKILEKVVFNQLRCQAGTEGLRWWYLLPHTPSWCWFKSPSLHLHPPVLVALFPPPRQWLSGVQRPFGSLLLHSYQFRKMRSTTGWSVQNEWKLCITFLPLKLRGFQYLPLAPFCWSLSFSSSVCPWIQLMPLRFLNDKQATASWGRNFFRFIYATVLDLLYSE